MIVVVLGMLVASNGVVVEEVSVITAVPLVTELTILLMEMVTIVLEVALLEDLLHDARNKFYAYYDSASTYISYFESH